MKGRKALQASTDKTSEQHVIAVLERMLEDSKELCQVDDPVLQGQMQMILGLLADILETKDPHHHFSHVVEYE